MTTSKFLYGTADFLRKRLSPNEQKNLSAYLLEFVVRMDDFIHGEQHIALAQHLKYETIDNKTLVSIHRGIIQATDLNWNSIYFDRKHSHGYESNSKSDSDSTYDTDESSKTVYAGPLRSVVLVAWIDSSVNPSNVRLITRSKALGLPPIKKKELAINRTLDYPWVLVYSSNPTIILGHNTRVFDPHNDEPCWPGP